MATQRRRSRLFPDLGEPAVVALHQGLLHAGLVRVRPDEEGRVEHLNIDVELVHMPEPRVDVAHLARRLRRVVADVLVLGDQPAVADPELLLRILAVVGGDAHAGGLGDDHRRVAAVGFVHELPGVGRFEDMGVGIDGAHGELSRTAGCGDWPI